MTIKTICLSNVSKLKLSGNVTAEVGDIITQTTSGANIIVLDAARPYETIVFNGNLNVSVGDYITQASSGANAVVTASGANVTSVSVDYVTGSFVNIDGNIAINAVEIESAVNRGTAEIPIWANVGIVPVSALDRNSTIISYIYNNSNEFDFLFIN